NLTFLEIGEKLERRIAECDAVVCLIGFVYGGEPSDRPPDQPRRSYTQWEYFLARQLGQPGCLLLADGKTEVDEPSKTLKECDAPSKPGRAAHDRRQPQEASRAEPPPTRDGRPFANPDHLRADLALLRFPWEAPPPDLKPCNLPLPSIGSLFKGREDFLDDLR